MSDTTEILGGAPTAPEDAPAAAGATASTSKSRSRGGTGLSSLLMPELQRIAQTLAIPGAGRMRKSQLIEAIEARQGGGPRQESSAARPPAGGSRPAAAGGQASRVVPLGQQGSDQRAASAGADVARLQKQDAMEPDTHSRPGIGASAQSGLGDGAPVGLGADGAAQQQLSFYEEADSAARRDSVTQDGAAPAATEAAQGDTQRGDRRRRNG
ncbi:MAG: Rho termination factor N-terminal domain-containing protein, partial [Streptosporangiaceae bacterium]